MSEPKDNTLHLSIEIPKHRCGTHGDHEHWVTFSKSGEPTVLYCLECIRDFLDCQSIGKVVLR